LEFIAQIGAAKHLRAAALTAGENIAEHLAEDIAERLAGAEPAAAAALEPGVAELIIDGALVRIAQNLVGFLEFVFGFGIVRIAVRMKFHGKPAVGLLDVRFRRALREIESLVIILLRHRSPRAYGPQKTNRRHSNEHRRFRLDLAIPRDPKGLQAFLRSLSLTSSN